MAEYILFIIVIIIPGFIKEDISWVGHLGGVIGGLIAGSLMLLIAKRRQIE